nr:SRPBCC family protein [uncultured Dyadobacter sp.]
MASTTNSRLIHATPATLFRAFSRPEALETWMAPSGMTGKVHAFDFRKGGGYRMSLYYPESDGEFRGKTGDREDQYEARFIEIVPNERIVEVITFNSEDEKFKSEMTMEVTFEPQGGSTMVTFTFRNIPPGIRPEDNEAGTEETLDKLAKYVG